MDAANDLNVSMRRIVITEDEDLDLDTLLLGDNSGVAGLAASAPSSPPAPAAVTSSLQAIPASPLAANDAPAALAEAAPCSDGHDAAPSSPILACEDACEEDDGDEGGCGHWVLPAPARPGDYINRPLHRVPSKSILKTVSSYGNFESIASVSSSASKQPTNGGASGGGLARTACSMLNFKNVMDGSSSSQGSSSGRRGQVFANNGNNPLDSSLSRGAKLSTKTTSYLNLSMGSINSRTSHDGSQQQVSIGWDLDGSSSTTQSPSYSGMNNFVPSGVVPLPSVPSLGGLQCDDGAPTTTADAVAMNARDADRAAGMDSSGSRHSVSSGKSGKVRRNVSFHSVDVREYDRTVGDNPSCRSGPPLSLDWSYSKKYNKGLDEYELERSSDRVQSLKKLHMNKYKRRNVLAFHWDKTEDEMKAARQGTKKMQRQRSMTQMLLPVHMAEEAFIGFKKFVQKKKKKGGGNGGGEDRDDWSELSNSASTKDSTQRNSQRYYDTASTRSSSQRGKAGLCSSAHSA